MPGQMLFGRGLVHHVTFQAKLKGALHDDKSPCKHSLLSCGMDILLSIWHLTYVSKVKPSFALCCTTKRAPSLHIMYMLHSGKSQVSALFVWLQNPPKLIAVFVMRKTQLCTLLTTKNLRLSNPS